MESGDREEAMAQKLWPDHARKPTPVSRHICCSYCNDGGPTFAMQRIIEAKHQGQPMQDHFGLFHTLLEIHRKIGEMSGPTDLRDI